MLSDQIRRTAQQLIESSFRERDQMFRTELRQISEEMAARGMFSSGLTITRARELCEAEVAIRMQIAFRELIRTISVVGLGEVDDLVQDIMQVVNAMMQTELPNIAEYYLDLRQRAGDFGQGADFLEEVRERNMRKFEAEAQLFVAALGRKTADREGRTIINVQGSSVGAIQTGAGASATINQGSPEERAQLLEALRAVRKALSGRATVEGYEVEHIVELVDEAEREVQKDDPNLLRLRSASTAIATTIQTAAALQPAYQVLKFALMPFGITLP